MSDYKIWEIPFYHAFNEAYQSYLNNSPPILFMNIFLEKIISITESKSGFIMSMDSNRYLSIEALCGQFSEEAVLLPENNNVDHLHATHAQAIKNNKIIIDETSVCIPYEFDGQVIGQITLANRSTYEHSMTPYFKILSTLLGVLQNNYFKLKKPDEFMTYQLFEHIINFIRDGTIVVNNNFNIMYINQCGANIINSVDVSEFRDQDLTKIFPQLAILNQGTADSPKKLFRDRRIVSDAIEFIVNSVICHHKVYHVVMLYEQDKPKRESPNFIAYLSHELRNPLQSINLAAYLLQIDLKHEKGGNISKVNNYLNTISKSCFEMKKIINDILDLDKIEAHEFIIEFDICDVRELVGVIFEEFVSLASDKKLELTLDVIERVPKTIYTDEVRLSQILSNLLSNALKYSKSGEIKLVVDFDEIDHGITFTVIDHGEGIRVDELPNLFKQYCQTSCSDKFNSNGLGLCVSQKIAHLLGGHISVVSAHKKGSTFTLFHPIRLGSSGSTIGKNKFTRILVGKILIVDDNESNLILFRLMLDHLNCAYKYNLEVHTMRDGKDAIDITKSNEYDIIFMDINMPGIDGCTACRIIKTNGFKGKIIATTGNILVKKEKEKFKYFDDVMIKPYDDTLVLNMLNIYLSTQ
ncbi:MAG: hybrid sensor histidine kinase/response regulator [Hyperionvirus sp.]|uniref:histidine kinase n=1 Tax=Hyperionvirus sp. TaxID=2487770 RepID=A0A3G5A8R7_9VIRU|nr:MAG: hybrid sensor histidine kinase/response regulator [Hyperionvirus sp.]